jgi:hypothetical protein
MALARLRRLVAAGGEPLVMRALEAGHASPAHVSDEVRRLTGLTPVRFLKEAPQGSACAISSPIPRSGIPAQCGRLSSSYCSS